jgi:PncC family amidohydrolase
MLQLLSRRILSHAPTFNQNHLKTIAKMSSSSSDASTHFPPPSLRNILNEVTSLLRDRNQTIAIAETAAGGLLSSSILSTPGASKIYKGGLTLYTLPSRIAYAGWSDENIKGYSGPTPDIVAGLAKHVRGELKADYVIAESGTAGPTGGDTRNRTPGYVALAVDCEKGTFTREVETGLGGDRVGNMVRFAEEGLKLVKDVINGDAKL